MNIPTLGIAALAAAFLPSVALASEKLIGFTEFDLASCAGPPLQVMDFGAEGRMYVYQAGNVTTSLNRVFNTYIGSARSNTCQATVIFQGGRVTKVTYQKSGGLLTREIQCSKLFGACKSLRKKK